MRLSINWLKDYIDPKLSNDELIHRLVMAGWEVETVETVGKDIVFELEITPNRPDCLNTLGLAREIGAITAKKVKYPKVKSYKPSAKKLAVSIEDKKDCSRYVATLINDVAVKNSPQEISERLASMGINSISNAVDITNFVLMELGQPLHVFDYDKIIGGKVMVRRAKDGEKIITIDGVERTLDPSILVIADAERPVAIAGIMGGKATEVTAATKNILLESAHFNMTIVRRASRKLGLRSDSSYRFERNVAYDGVLTGADRATDLLVDLAQGKVAARADISSAAKKTVKAITVSEAQIEARLGEQVPVAKAKKILSSLDFKVTAKGKTLSVKAPAFRGDIKETVDLIEEVARIIGFDHMPVSLPQIKAKNLVVNPRPSFVKKTTRQAMIGNGFDEIVTLSMINTKDLHKCQQQNLTQVRVFNPLTSDQELMRPSLLPSVMQVLVGNFNHGQKSLRLFEIAPIYQPDGEKLTVGILLTGARYQDWRLSRREQVEFADLKGALENMARSLGVRLSFEATSQTFLDESCQSAVMLNGRIIGNAGRLNKNVLQQWDIKHQDVYYAQINLEEIIALPPATIRFESLAEFPPVTRDVSLAVKKDVSYGAIQQICQQNSSDILRDIQFIEQYVGDKIASDQKALVFSLVYQSKTRTLREEEVSTAHQRIVDALIQQLGATRR